MTGSLFDDPVSMVATPLGVVGAGSPEHVLCAYQNSSPEQILVCYSLEVVLKGLPLLIVVL